MKNNMIIGLATVTLFLGVSITLNKQHDAKAQEINKNLEININDKKIDDKIWELKIDSNGNKYLKFENEEIREAWRYDEQKNLIPVSMEEHLGIMNNTIKTGDLGISFDDVNLGISKEKSINTIRETKELSKYRYVQVSGYSAYGEAIRISPFVDGSIAGAEFTDENQTYISSIYGGKALGNTRVKNAIALGVDFEWNNIVLSNNNKDKIYEIPAGKIGYIEFIPKITYSKGNVYRDVYNGANIKIRTEELGEAQGISPNKLVNGYADGVFSLKTFAN